VWVEVVVTPKDLELVRVGETVTITSAANDTSATGKVSYVGNLLASKPAPPKRALSSLIRIWRGAQACSSMQL
jgi:cobalt-zinc-cadmium efflux system membrane fusion protein